MIKNINIESDIIKNNESLFNPMNITQDCLKRWYIFCCTFRRITPPRNYLALFLLKLGLSSVICDNRECSDTK